ncbi:MAG: hypothetical protein IPH03_03730 [Tetrasphaera sp.]|nr:hypothetical protein [Tetrasphaera sp.]
MALNEIAAKWDPVISEPYAATGELDARDRYWIAAHAAVVKIALREAQREAAARRADTHTAA